MGKASTDNQKAVDLFLGALNNNSFSQEALLIMLKVVVPFMVKYEIERMVESIDLDIYDLEDLNG